MKIRLQRTRDLATIERLDRACFPGDEPVKLHDAAWWIVTYDGEPVAFAGAKFHLPDNAVFLCRAGVLPVARGQGLQRRLIRARLTWARKAGAIGCYTYTAAYNCRSANNLIKEGFRTFWPAWEFGGEGCVYWWKSLIR